MAGFSPGHLRIESSFRNWEFQLPLQRKALAPRVFHFGCNAIAPAVFYLDFHAAVKAPVPGVLSHILRAVKKALATKVFHYGCSNSASMLFHTLVLAFPLVASPDHFHPRSDIQLTRPVEFDLLNSGHFPGSVQTNRIACGSCTPSARHVYKTAQTA